MLTREQIEEIIRTTGPAANLEGQNLRGLDLSGLNLTGATLNSADLNPATDQVRMDSGTAETNLNRTVL